MAMYVAKMYYWTRTTTITIVAYTSSHPPNKFPINSNFLAAQAASLAKEIARPRASQRNINRGSNNRRAKDERQDRNSQEEEEEPNKKKSDVSHFVFPPLGWWSTVVFLAFQLRGVCRSILIYSITGMMRVHQTDRQTGLHVDPHPALLAACAAVAGQGAARSGSETRYVVVIFVSHRYCVYV
ncbi:hypothetical protein BC567DRAFT_49841 [Phyllosticta citribraziliensis]